MPPPASATEPFRLENAADIRKLSLKALQTWTLARRRHPTSSTKAWAATGSKENRGLEKQKRIAPFATFCRVTSGNFEAQ